MVASLDTPFETDIRVLLRHSDRKLPSLKTIKPYNVWEDSDSEEREEISRYWGRSMGYNAEFDNYATIN